MKDKLMESSRAGSRNKKWNKWRTAFLLLLSINIVVFITLAVSLTGGFSRNETAPDNLLDQSKGAAIFTVQADKSQLEALINDQLRSSKNDRLDYRVVINRQFVIKGNYRLLFTGIPFTLTFNPTVSHGDIILNETDVKIGSLSLPDKEVLRFLKMGTDFPEWVVIRPEQRQIYIDLTKVEIQDGLYLRAKSIHLPDEVSFTVHRQK